MIDVVDGSAVRQLLEKVGRRPDLYRRVVISAPFIDEYGIDLLERLGRDFERHSGPNLDLVVRPELVDRVTAWAGNRNGVRVIVRYGLHAKVYAALGLHPVANECLITSSNLTTSGVSRNLELGIVLRGCTPRLAALIERATHHVTC